MDDFLILYSGMFCFGMIGLGVALTVHEFKKMARVHDSLVRDSAEKKPGPAIASAPLKHAL